MRTSRKKKIDKKTIKSLLAIKGKTIQQMCAEICDRYEGIAPITISDCIKKESIMLEDLELIAQYLDVHPNELLIEGEKLPDPVYGYRKSVGKRIGFNDYYRVSIETKLTKEREKIAAEILGWFMERYPGFINNADAECKDFIMHELENSVLFDMIEETIESAYAKCLLYQKTGEYPFDRFEHTVYEKEYRPK